MDHINVVQFYTLASDDFNAIFVKIDLINLQGDRSST